jgi:hypothetical protein
LAGIGAPIAVDRGAWCGRQIAEKMASATIPAAKMAALFMVTSKTDRHLHVSVKPTIEVGKWCRTTHANNIFLEVGSWRALLHNKNMSARISMS